ncbi:MAG: HAMP domain-containing histidine kinase [Candidatus Eisenbacteria bacterium]|uniref:histidine kinase n=1 Tax=Eiseniibacteriota bacterium TaxID=2212470 RepID=A0A948W705_UNCEI|nr:HAMP domain-containing histidine kinase [Candidatus Eisenbacteria bacterium]MBU1947398.1 HAMP domain-containing histidine kinase [Candidatus Eisenbacteria bacterium]MBU2692079.1 HAMP domain-containing histidine kinase [Candidatus Eisenbacteria bacterium]
MMNDKTADTELIAEDSAQFVSATSLRIRTDWFNRIRWGVGAWIMALVLLAEAVYHIPLPLPQIILVLAVLLLLNVTYVIRNRRVAPTEFKAEIRMVKIEMILDLLFVTVLLNFSGGLENPFYFIYAPHVLIASLLFKGREIYQITFAAALMFTGLVIGEFTGILPHYQLMEGMTASSSLPYITVTLVVFWPVLFGIAYLGARIMRHNRSIKDELVLRQRQLIVADKAKIDFFRYVSHEVKTPIVTAQSALEAVLQLSGDELPEKSRDMLLRAVKRLNQAINIVKDLSEITKTRMHAVQDVKEINLNEMIDLLLQKHTERITEKQIRVETHLPQPTVILRGNETMIEMMIGNLISNAVRYNRTDGQIDITVRDLGVQIAISVADSGIGIAPENRERVFEEFYRSPEAREISSAGTGLGLHIVKQFVEQLGGAVQVESEQGKGSTFTIYLPTTKKL